MSQPEVVRRFALKGALFQFPMITLWGVRGFLFIDGVSSFGKMVCYIGMSLMVLAMLRIYFFNKPKRELLTSDVFKLTRHPMYHGMFIADAALFFGGDLGNPLLWATWVLFVALLLLAGWFQEKETLARFGVEAEAYYAKTPRFIFGWLWK